MITALAITATMAVLAWSSRHHVQVTSSTQIAPQAACAAPNTTIAARASRSMSFSRSCAGAS